MHKDIIFWKVHAENFLKNFCDFIVEEGPFFEVFISFLPLSPPLEGGHGEDVLASAVG